MRLRAFKKIFCILLISSLSTSVSAQTSPAQKETVYKDWQMLSDSKNVVEIFYCVVKCNGENKIYLKIFNDGIADQDINVALEIMNNADSKSFTISKKIAAKKRVFHIATCDSDTLSELKITLPNNFDPSGISVKQIL